MARIRVLLADDHTVLRQGIAQVLEAQDDIEVVAEAADGLQAYQLTKRHLPDIVLIDINMPKMDGVKATAAIKSSMPETGVIILTMYRRDDFVFEAIKAGASGYLLKEVELAELVEAIRVVARGEAVIDPTLAGRIFAELRGEASRERSASEPDLAARDLEILRLLARGSTNREIADHLHLSEKTVRNRLSLVFRHLHLKNRTEAALFAIRQGLTDEEKDGGTGGELRGEDTPQR